MHLEKINISAFHAFSQLVRAVSNQPGVMEEDALAV